MKTSILLAINLLATAFLFAQIPVIGGWSQFAPSADSRLIYVSDVSGNDATATFYLPSNPLIGADAFLPTGAILPFKTIAAAKTQLRTGFPDWLLFKNGETWTNQNFGVVTLSGRAATEPMLIGAYGACGNRPRILTGVADFMDFAGASASHVAIAGIYATPQNYLGVEDCVAVRLYNTTFLSFLVEDCFFEKFVFNLTTHSIPSYGQTSQNLKVRRCILTESFKVGGNSSGVFIANVNGVLFEENLIDHNGWHPTITGAGASGQSHNTYFQVSNTNLVFQKNIVSRASATGGGFRCGGLIDDNLFAANPKNIQFGTHETVNGTGGGLNWPTQFRTGEVKNNVLLDCRVEPFENGTGIQVQRAKGTAVHHNLVAGFTPVSTYNVGAVLNEVETINFHHNIVHDWGNNQTAGVTYSSALICGAGMIGTNQVAQNDFQVHNERGSCVSQNVAFAQTAYSGNRYFNVLTGGNWYSQWFQPQGNYAGWLAASGETGSTNTDIGYLDPTRNVATYLTSIGGSGGLPGFVAGRKLNSRCDWDDQFSATAVNDYMREGFGLSLSLPIELMVFEARAEGKKVALHWEMNADPTLLLVEIERSADGIFFEKIGEKRVGLGENQPIRGQFWDEQPMAENFYRLKMVAADGQFSFSRLAHFSRESSADLWLQPNPASDFLEISAPNFEPERVEIFNQFGQKVFQAETSGRELRLPIAGLPSGKYWLRAVGGGFWAQKSFLKVRS